jgi:hypothetical protein
MKDGNKTQEPKLLEKFSVNEWQRIFYLVQQDLPKVYVVPFYMSIYQVYKHRYMVSSTIVMLIFIFGFGWPILSFFVPLIPIIFVNVFSLLESTVITFKMNKVHNQLIAEGIQIQWDELMDVVMLVIMENYLPDSDEDDDNRLDTI